MTDAEDLAIGSVADEPRPRKMNRTRDRKGEATGSVRCIGMSLMDFFPRLHVNFSRTTTSD